MKTSMRQAKNLKQTREHDLGALEEAVQRLKNNIALFKREILLSKDEYKRKRLAEEFQKMKMGVKG